MDYSSLLKGKKGDATERWNSLSLRFLLPALAVVLVAEWNYGGQGEGGRGGDKGGLRVFFTVMT